jgi:hypothetical protein
LQTAAKTIDGPRSENVETARSGVPQHAIKPRPLVTSFGSADASVLIDGNDLPPALSRYGLKLAAWFSAAPFMVPARLLMAAG